MKNDPPNIFDPPAAPLPGLLCPACRRLNDQAEAADFSNAKPSPGDLSVCIYCGEFATYTEGLRLKLLTEDDFSRLPHANKLELLHAKKFVFKIRRQKL